MTVEVDRLRLNRLKGFRLKAEMFGISNSDH
jgi:hypothetical protein